VIWFLAWLAWMIFILRMFHVLNPRDDQ